MAGMRAVAASKAAMRCAHWRLDEEKSLRAVTSLKVAMRCAHWRMDGEFEGGDLVEGGAARIGAWVKSMRAATSLNVAMRFSALAP